jgi:hypothetical protein
VWVLCLCSCLTAGVCLCLANPVAGQETPPPGPPPKAEAAHAKNAAQSATTPPPETKPKEKSDNTEEKKGKKEEKHRGSLVIAPLPLVSPAIGSGVIPIAGYIFPFSKNDKVSPPSTVGGFGLITNNGTRAWGFGGQLFLKKDTYEVASARCWEIPRLGMSGFLAAPVRCDSCGLRPALLLCT